MHFSETFTPHERYERFSFNDGCPTSSIHDYLESSLFLYFIEILRSSILPAFTLLVVKTLRGPVYFLYQSKL